MKIINWNCNGAFRNKFESIQKLNGDIYVIQECENPEHTKSKGYKEFAKNHIWIGDSKNKGIAIFAKPNIKLKRLDWSDKYEDHKVKYFLPVSINNSLKILIVWTHRNNSPNFGYIGQFWKYLKVNKQNLKDTIIIGDFNSNKIWDQWDRWWNHSDVVKELKEIGLESVYHVNLKEEQGKETRPTFHLYKKKDRPYHIDYCFAPRSIKIKSFELKKYDDWVNLSDHVPMVVTLE